jgi:hypothetical protein
LEVHSPIAVNSGTRVEYVLPLQEN